MASQCDFGNDQFSDVSPWLPNIPHKSMEDLISRLCVTPCSNQDMSLTEAFELLSWRSRRGELGKTEINPLWISFSKMVAFGAYYDAASLLVPDGYMKASSDTRSGSGEAYLSYVNATNDVETCQVFYASSPALALTAACVDAWKTIRCEERRLERLTLVSN